MKNRAILRFQDPANIGSPFLLEELLDACETAEAGGGAFAYATRSGVGLLLEDEAFVSFVSKKPFDLVLGIDEVTDSGAIDRALRAKKALPNLLVRAFMHQRNWCRFHPKMCWFRYKRGGRVIAGSGNLTLGGLRANWEAFTVTNLTSPEIDEIEKAWLSWTNLHASLLLPIGDPRVLERATKNIVRRTPSHERPDLESSASDEDVTVPPSPGQSVLVAEMVRGGGRWGRWKQANFDLENYEGYFGAKRGTQRRILLQHVRQDGRLDEIEPRRSVEVLSRNFRLELGAASGIPYPDAGRPIAVFVRLQGGIFRYRLLLPNDPGYGNVSTLLDNRWTGPSTRVRRVRMELADLRQAWPDLPSALIGEASAPIPRDATT